MWAPRCFFDFPLTLFPPLGDGEYICTNKRGNSTYRISILQGTGTRHTGAHSHLPKPENSNTTGTLNAVTRGSKEINASAPRKG